MAGSLVMAQQPAPETVAKTEVAKTESVLAPGAKEAVDLSTTWVSSGSTPSIGSDGRVMYAFGSGLVPVVCAPMRVCVIELQAGEEIGAEVQIGDSKRWLMSPASYGAGESKTMMIALRPLAVDLDTNLVIPTNRRCYFIHLVSDKEKYVARTAFVYAEDDNANAWRKHAIQQEQEHQRERMTADNNGRTVLLPAQEAMARLDYNYDVTPNKYGASIRPVKVYADTKEGKTYFEMPASIGAGKAPGLYVVSPEGKDEEANYRVLDGPVPTYVADVLAPHFRLRVGVSKKSPVVDITHRAKERT
jgi:type IV secretion system protein VirB9